MINAGESVNVKIRLLQSSNGVRSSPRGMERAGDVAGAGAQNGNASRMRAGASASQTATAAPDPESHFNIMHSIFT